MNRFIRPVHRFLASRTTHLSLTYLAIIMVMSIAFSVIFFNTSSHELGRQLPPAGHHYATDFRPQDVYGPDSDDSNQPTSLNSFLHERVEEGRHNLLLELLALNIGALVLGSMISYQLARRTLEPIEAAMEAQAQFVSDASHELRTPLTAIQTSNEVALRKPNLTLAQAKSVIRSNNDDVQRLQELAEGLLRLARQENQQLPLEPVSLQAAAGEAMNHCIQAAMAKHISIADTTKPTQVLADAGSLSQIVTILIDNAIKYSPEKSTIYLESTTNGKFGLLTVRDEGIGIAADQLPQIFKRFYRIDTARSSSQTAGYGLGLSIAHKLIELLHGELTVRSKLGQGSSFIIRLPLA